MDLTTFLAQLVSILRVKLYKEKRKKEKKYVFLIFVHFFSKCTFLRLWHFFLALWLSNQLNFSVVVHIYKIRVFDKAFFLLTIRMPMITKLSRVVACFKELSPTNAHDISTEWPCGVTQIKYIYLYLQKMYRHHKRQGADLVLRGSQTWPFDQLINIRSRDCLQNLYLHFHEVYT